MPVSVAYSTTGGGSTERCRITLTDILPGEILTFDWDAPATGATHTYEITGTDETAEYGLLETDLDSYIVSQGADSYWEYCTTTNGTTYLDILYPTFVGRISVTSDNGGSGGGSVATKLWIGNAQAVAQVSEVTIGNVVIGDEFTLQINGKTITVTATAATAANVVALFKSAIETTSIAEWREVTPSIDGDLLVLTANTAGVPFTVTSATASLGVSVKTIRTSVAGGNMTQTFRIPQSASGTFTITIGDQTTSSLSASASAGTVETAIEGLSTIGTGNASVARTTDANDYIYAVTFDGSLAATTVATMIVRLTSTKPLVRTTQAGATTGTPVNEIQTVDCGNFQPTANTFTLTLDGQTTSTLSYTSSATDVQTALTNLSNVETVTVTKTGNVFTIEFGLIDGMANQSQLVASVYSGSASAIHDITPTLTAIVTRVDEQQRITLTGAPSGGTFTITFNGQTTSGIAYNASASTVQTALEGLANIDPGDVTVTGSAGGPWTVTFVGKYAGTNVVEMTGTSSLTGTSGQSLSISTTTASTGPNNWDNAANWSPSGVPASSDNVRFEIGNVDCLYGLDQSAVTLASLHIAMSYTGRIGLKRVNDSGYLEYRTRHLTIGCTDLKIGTVEGSGSGPTMVRIDTGTAATTITVKNSGSGAESGIPAVVWIGDHNDNVVTVYAGEFGTSWWSDEDSHISSLTQLGGSVYIKNCTIDDALDTSDQDFRAVNCTLGGKPLSA